MIAINTHETLPYICITSYLWYIISDVIEVNTIILYMFCCAKMIITYIHVIEPNMIH